MRKAALTFKTAIGTVLALAAMQGTAAATNIDDMRTAQAAGQSPFLQALTDEYRQITIFEADEMYDWPDADHFARKGLAAAGGDIVLPEELANWDLPPDKIDELTAARGRLMQQLDTGARDSKAELAARAQADFDCWVEQQEENHQPDDIAACRDDFLASMAELEAPPPAMAAAPAPAPAPRTIEILFDWDSAKLTPAGQAVIDQIVAETGSATANISAIGHADRSGSEDYNMTLSLERADAVRQALIAGGTPAQSITTAGRGEAEPAVPTPDGVREDANRRVEVFLP